MIGETLGKYEILEEVGQGGMSVVYRGADGSLDREVAVKVLHPHLAGRKGYRARFHREARAVARLSHPNIPEIYDFSDDGEELAYLVTEYVPGPTLRDFAEANPIEVPEVGVAVVACLAGALQHAHDNGVIHRDVKPENVIIAPGGVLKLTDFGIAHIEDAQGLTATGTLLGSPAHMSPEHIEGKPLDPRADVFALGTVLYWLVTDELPFLAPNPQALFRAILDGEFTPAVRERPSVGDAISAVIDKAMARDAADRYTSALAMRAALVEVLDHAGFGEQEPEELVVGWFGDPPGYETLLRDRVVAGLVERGRKLVSQRRKAAALRCYSRVLALAPEDTEAAVRAEIEALLAADRRALWAKRVGGALAAVAAVGLMLWWFPSAGTGKASGISGEAETGGILATGEDPTLAAPAAAKPPTLEPKLPAAAVQVTATSKASPIPRRATPRRRSGSRTRGTSRGTAKPPGREVRVASATAIGKPPPTDAGPIWLPIKARPYADVYVDGTKVAAHPPQHRIQLKPGARKITFKKQGNRDRTFNIDVPPDGTGLKPLAFWWPAIVEVKGAKGFIVQVEGKDLGSTDAAREFQMNRESVARARVVVLDPKSGPVHEQVVALRAGGKVVVNVPSAR